jgi:hypothetical protein
MNYINILVEHSKYNGSVQNFYFGNKSFISEVLSENNLNWIKTIQSFSLLEDNWDSYKGEKPSPEAIIKAINFCLWLSESQIEIFFTAPTPDGDILIEIKNLNANLEFIFSGHGKDRVISWCDGDFSSEAELNETTQNSYLKWLICPDGNCPDFK